MPLQMLHLTMIDGAEAAPYCHFMPLTTILCTVLHVTISITDIKKELERSVLPLLVKWERQIKAIQWHDRRKDKFG